MRLHIMRHGATASNALRRYVGRGTDEPLSSEGRAQCLRFGTFPEVSHVYVSPMLRARQTAETCFPNARLEAVAGLEEYDFGQFEGRSAHDMVDDQAYRAWVDGGCIDACPGGESRAGFVSRSNDALAGILRGASSRGEEEVFVVAHGGTIMAAFSEFAQSEVVGEAYDPYFSWQVGPCGGYSVSVHIKDGCITFDEVAPLGISS